MKSSRRYKDRVAICILIVTVLLIRAVPSKSESLQSVENKIQSVSGHKDIRNKMVLDILRMWTMWLEDWKVPHTDKRWTKINEYAYYIADSVLFYQTQGELYKNKTIKLPIHYSTHILVATMVIIESGLKHKTVGKLGEVGLLQIHSYAKNRHKSKQIKENPALGIFLGVRWLTIQLASCGSYRLKNWNYDKWIGSVSSYCAGFGVTYRNGKCRNIKAAWKRINLAKKFKNRIIQQEFIELYGTLGSGGD
jgi:hypothetical protein